MELPYTLGATHFRNPIYINNYHISIVKFGWVGEDRASTKLVNSKVDFFINVKILLFTSLSTIKVD